MKIFDVHIHASNTKPNPEELLASMAKAGVYGSCVFSNRPPEYKTGTSFDERLEEVLAWTKGYEDRLFPVIWIDPREENIIENIHRAAEKGICAFKIICTDYYIYEDRCMEVLREIAKLDKPVFFHSGILWGTAEKASSKYNRPLNWERLKGIKGLRFSLGHCSWPWIDECIALYGEFLNASRGQGMAEMFFDITPGTPPIYREELLRKMYTCGYDVGNNVMFGTDCSAEQYNNMWTEKWLLRDRKIMENLGISKENIQKMYSENLLKFLGKAPASAEHICPLRDSLESWSPVNESVAEVIEKWYNKLNFPDIYKNEFYRALEEVKISDAISIDTYDLYCEDGKRNLLSILYLCEELAQRYKEKGISEEILNETLHDIVVWTSIWSGIKGGLYLGELSWLSKHLGMKLFKIGRLQFAFGKAEHAVPEKNISKGDNVIEIHIPEGAPLSKEDCLRSIEAAKAFFAKYYPDYSFEYFTCHSWLLDETLKEIAAPESNILKFAEMFDVVKKEESDAILKYVFRWDTTRYTLRHTAAASSLAQKVKKYALSGGSFFEATGVIKK